MPQAVLSSSSNVVPITYGKRAQPTAASDCFVGPPATSLQEAKERLFAELPPKPDCTGMPDHEVMLAMWDWLRMRVYVYDTVLFG